MKNAESVGSQNAKEIDYLSQVYNDDILELIDDRSINHAIQNLFRKRSKTTGPFKEGKILPNKKSKHSILVLIGIRQLPHLTHFWASDPFLT